MSTHEYCILDDKCFCGIGLRCGNWRRPPRTDEERELLKRTRPHIAKQIDMYSESFESGMPPKRSGYGLLIAQIEDLRAGVAVRAHGSVWYLPLCHDSYGEGNG